MKRFLSVSGALALLLVSATAAPAGPVGYTLDVTTFYQFGAPPNNNGYSGSPDTGFFTITNNGTSTFSGTIKDVAVSQFSGDFSQSFSVTLAPGQSFTLGTSFESSNVGGFNGPFGTIQPGIEIDLIGNMSKGANTEGVNLSVNDSNIHSGVPRTDPSSGVTTDAYVLQGGDPFGFDNGDGYETTQAPGHFRFFEAGQTSVTPEPASLTLLGIGVAGLAGHAWRKRKKAA